DLTLETDGCLTLPPGPLISQRPNYTVQSQPAVERPVPLSGCRYASTSQGPRIVAARGTLGGVVGVKPARPGAETRYPPRAQGRSFVVTERLWENG
ncbi:MAG TPA: hypothetical protein VMS40_14125, partial [Vicinamibacterales bacterium]|nr:hypothetical protein [Vicinamibacterales bacterium]